MWAAAIYSLVGTSKLNGLDPEGYLRQVLTRLPIITNYQPTPPRRVRAAER